MAVPALGTEAILPDALYPVSAFERTAGISPARRSEAKKHGIELEVLEVGRRKFTTGKNAIDYLHRLAAHTAAPRCPAQFTTMAGPQAGPQAREHFGASRN
ncbi:hypothetical protein NG895_12295 [Aeoliella sp. ICT_H6.2]|uniref:Uncharacterized protein n=1 Tax=Aeoliella straminimaris TaxID=2954799 RepID=A0A9X2FE62_9BACT|nr:hypothetical protein [Aeoliella straminimaris]MCO6044689.1 hypothetical protein [Aeoliella straminimaris]